MLWFFFSLFIVQALYIILSYLIKNLRIRTIFIVLLVACGFMLHKGNLTNVFKIGTSLTAIGYYHVGHLFRKLTKENLYKIRIFILATLFCVVGSLLMLHISGCTYDLIGNQAFDVVLNYITALAGIYCVLFVSYYLQKNILGNITAYIGKNSLYFYPITGFVPDFSKAFFGSFSWCKLISRLVAFLMAVIVTELSNKSDK